jgi:PPOX class probable F420-dependent enzyme
MTALPDALVALLHRPSPCFMATTMPDGSPQLTEVWVDTDGEHILVNTVQSHTKARNIARDPRVAISVADPDDVSNYFSVRGTVLKATTHGAAEHIDRVAQKYTGRPYPWYGGRDQVRLLLTIRADRIVHAPRG